ncbi:hypothetical protein A0J48_002295 [Sphaerospermopsis aphanizomenoides BCCUSP55]|uniref:hypothetical protein n=1 Tax=Sphaerospermopsis aphanizomenoides TaxID=459663 RepID=UPI001904EBF8|nr:hypothetical protein [Sphaerospermopsis aphanizomenoides]MBK1986390.1 hypothetical protein [Sphaerospermopsis aphanizomenoides BCCUSP55]
MQQKIRKVYSLKEYSTPDIFYHSLTPALGIILSIFAGWEIILFCFILGLFISILILDIDNCYEVITCNFNSTFGRITIRQKNIFSQGVMEIPLHEIETALIKSSSSSFTTKTSFGKKIQIDSQLYWIVIILNSGEHCRLTYYETSLFSSKQQMIDYILFLKENT